MDTYTHACPLISSHFFSQTGYRGIAMRVLGSATYTHNCLHTVSNSDTACSEGMLAGAKFGVTTPSHVQPTIGEHDTYMSAFGAFPLCRRE